MDEFERAAGEPGIGAVREQLLVRLDAPADHAPIGQVEGLRDLRRAPHDLGVALDAARADELEAELGHLARGARVARRRPHDRGVVAQAQREPGGVQPRGDHADDGEGVVGPHHQEATVVVEQLERGVRDAAPSAQRVAVLEQRRLHRQVAMALQDAPHRERDVLARLRLLGQNVAESPWCGRHPRAPSPVRRPPAASARADAPRLVLSVDTLAYWSARCSAHGSFTEP